MMEEDFNAMKRLIIIGVVFVLLLVVVLPVSAQRSYSNTSGIEVTVPPGWTTFDVDGGVIVFSPDESAGAWFQAFYAPPGSIGNTCLPIVLDTFSSALTIEGLSIDPEAPNLAYIDYDGGNGLGMIVCDIVTETLVIGSALVSAQNTYEVNWPIVADMYFSVSVDAALALTAAGGDASQSAQVAPAQAAAADVAAIHFDLPAGWAVNDAGDTYVLISDANGWAVVYLEYRPHTPGITMESCLQEFIDELMMTGMGDLNVVDAGYLAGEKTAYAEFVFNGVMEIGVAACNLDSAQFAHLWLITVPREAFDNLWADQIHIITTAQFPGDQAAPAVAQPPAQAPVVAPPSNINDPFAALGGVSQPEQPAASNNPFAQSGIVGQSPSNLTFVSFTDPNERAFSLDVPQGWAVEGGMYDVFGTKLVFFGMVSPDESVVTFVGQTEILISLQPTPQLTQAGYPEGTAIYADNNFYIRVAAYQTGAEAAQALVEANFAPLCTQFAITDKRDLPEASGFTPDQSAFVSAGEVAYTCTVDGTEAAGYQYATTYATVDSTYGEVWMIQDIYGFIAETSHTDAAITALVRASNTFTVNEQWLLQQQAALQQGLVQQQQQMMDDATYYALLSQMSAMQHQTSMAIINSIGDSSWEWQYDYDYGW